MKTKTFRMLAAFLAMLLFISAFPMSAFAANPFLPLWERIPDGEPRVFVDPETGKERLYLYGSHDSRVSGYCGPDHVVWSAPVDDLNNWRHEGEAFHVSQLNGLPFVDGDGVTRNLIVNTSNPNLYAPDVVYHPENNKYYMYVFVDGIWNTTIATPAAPALRRRHPMFVLSSDKPGGPFTDPKFVRLAFDPAVLVDDVKDENGKSRVYLYWTPEETRNSYACELDPNDMATMLPGTMRYPIGTTDQAPNNTMPDWNAPFYMFEGSSVRKVDNTYIMAYCRGYPRANATATTNISEIGWAYSANPMGPWTAGGVVVSNKGELIENPYGTGTSFTYPGGNVHGGMVKVNEQWYQVYHRDTNISSKRQAMVEPFDLRFVEGVPVIDQVELTSQGFELNGLDPFKEQLAGSASYIYPPVTNGPQFYSQPGTYNFNPNAVRDGWLPVQRIRHRSWLGYKYFNFGTGVNSGMVKLVLTLIASRAGTINIYANDPKLNFADTQKPKTLIGTIAMPANSARHTVEGFVDKSLLKGKKGIYLEILDNASNTTSNVCEINNLQFKLVPPMTDVSTPSMFGVKYEDTKDIAPGAVLLLAQYDALDRLVSISYKPIQSDSETLLVEKNPAAASFKAFVWSGDMIPIDEALSSK